MLIIYLATRARNDVRRLPSILVASQPQSHQVTTIFCAINEATTRMEEREVVDKLYVANLKLHGELVFFSLEMDHVKGFRLDLGHGRNTGHVRREPGSGERTAGVNEAGTMGGEVVHQGTSVEVALVESGAREVA